MKKSDLTFLADLGLMVDAPTCAHLHVGDAADNPLADVLTGTVVCSPDQSLPGNTAFLLTLGATAERLADEVFLAALKNQATGLVYFELAAQSEAVHSSLHAHLSNNDFEQLNVYPAIRIGGGVGYAYASPELLAKNRICGLLAANFRHKTASEAAWQKVGQLADALANERLLNPRRLVAAVERTRREYPHKLGSLLITSTSSLSQILALPKVLWAEYKHYRAQRHWYGAMSYQSKQARRFASIANRTGEHGLVAYVDSLTSSQKAEIGADSFSRYLASLADAFQFQRCVDEFEARYPNIRPQEIHFLGYRAIRSYTRSLMRCKRAKDAEYLLRALVQAFPEQPEYFSLLGGLLTDQRPQEAKSYLRDAIQRGSVNAMTDAGLLYRTLLLERELLSEAWYEVSTSGRGTLKALGNINFMLASMRVEAGEHDAAAAELNTYYAQLELAPIERIDSTLPFGIDNVHAPSATPATRSLPLVSVLMTTHNSAEFIDTAMRAVLGQTHSNLELIIVDDCSSDNTRQSLAEWAKVDARIRVFHNKRNVGTYGSKNLGLLHAKGEFITCHDSDDWSHPQKIERQLLPLLGSEARASISRWGRIDERGYFEAKRWGMVLHSNPSSLLYRRSVVDEIGYYDAVRTGADTEFENRIVASFGARTIIEIHACMAFGRSRSDSLTRLPELGFDEFGASPTRQAYWAAWGAWHREAISKPGTSLYIGFPPNQPRHFDIPAAISVDTEALRINVVSASPT